MNKNKSESGFTIVEMLVVISIIGILVTVAGIGYGSVQQSARDSVRLSDLGQIELALNLYRQENGHFPFESAGYSGSDLVGIICTDPEVCDAERLNTPINILIASHLGPVADPLHNETGSSDERYWYYYDGRKNCNEDYHVVTLHARQMEVESNINVGQLVDRCPAFNGSAGEGQGISPSHRTAQLRILEYLERTGSAGVNW